MELLERCTYPQDSGCEVAWRVARTVAAVRAAGTCGRWLDRWGHDGDDGALVLSELASNAVQYGDGDWMYVRLALTHDGDCVIEVSDEGRELPVVRAGTGLEIGGRGLRHVVPAIAAEWGWRPATPAGKTVWARLSRCSRPNHSLRKLRNYRTEDRQDRPAGWSPNSP